MFDKRKEKSNFIAFDSELCLLGSSFFLSGWQKPEISFLTGFKSLTEWAPLTFTARFREDIPGDQCLTKWAQFLSKNRSKTPRKPDVYKRFELRIEALRNTLSQEFVELWAIGIGRQQLLNNSNFLSFFLAHGQDWLFRLPNFQVWAQKNQLSFKGHKCPRHCAF